RFVSVGHSSVLVVAGFVVPNGRGGPKRGFEIVDVVEVFAAIVGSLVQVAGGDEVVDDLADVGGGAKAPLFQHGDGHHSELAERQPPRRVANLSARNVGRRSDSSARRRPGPPRAWITAHRAELAV